MAPDPGPARPLAAEPSGAPSPAATVRRAPSERLGPVLVDEDRLQARVSELAAEISRDHAGLDLLIVGVLKGAIFFIADLVRQLDVDCELDFMAVSSYGDATTSSGVVRILKDLDTPIAGRHVLIVEDIIDSGLTLSYLCRNLLSRGPASLEICALTAKPAAARFRPAPRYVGFHLPDTFVVGYGLDHGQRYRGLPYIAMLDGDAEPARQHAGSDTSTPPTDRPGPTGV